MKTSRVALMLCISIILVGAVFVRAPSPNPSILIPLASPSPSSVPCVESIASTVIQVTQVSIPSETNDLEVEGKVSTIKLPMIKNRATAIVGGQDALLGITATIQAGPDGIKNGQFVLTIQDGDPSQYVSKKKFSLGPCEELAGIPVNSKVDDKGVYSIQAPASGNGALRWEPEKPFVFTQSGDNKKIELKFVQEVPGALSVGTIVSEIIVEKVIETVPFKINWLGFAFKDDRKNEKRKSIDEADARSKGDAALFVKANYPVQSDQFFPTFIDGVLVIEDTRAQWLAKSNMERTKFLIALAVKEGIAAQLAGYDRRIFVVPDGMLPPGRKGQANTAGDKAVFVVSGAGSVAEAHELGHTKPWLLDDEYVKDEAGNIVVEGEDANGYLATLIEAKKKPGRPVTDEATSLGFMGSTGGFDERVVKTSHYKEKLIPAFDKENAKLDPLVWSLRAVLDVNDTNLTDVEGLEVLPIFQFDSIPDGNESCDSQPCVPLLVMVTLQDDSVIEHTLAVHTGGVIQDDAGLVEVNQSPIIHVFEVPGQPVKSIVIEDADGIVRFALDTTANAPELEILSVQVNKKSVVLSINGSDVDGGSLFASIFVRYPDGVLASGELDKLVLGPTDFVIDTELFRKGNYEFIVMLTDGFNTVEETVPFVI